MKRLGVDYGRRFLGLAVAVGGLAEPLATLEKDGLGKWRGELSKLVRDQRVEEVVVGVSEGKMAEETREFVGELGEVLQLPVRYQDETLSTKEAMRRIVEAGKSGVAWKREEHAWAAAVILQDYLDRIGGEGAL